MVRLRKHIITRRKNTLELQIYFMSKLRNPKKGRDKIRRKATRLRKIILLMNYLGV